MKISTLVITLTISFLSGCATIVGEPTQVLPISSTPDGASIVITDENGIEVFKGVTPTTVTLQKSDGSYYGGKSFTVAISKDGHESLSIPVKTQPNGWYIGGNLVFGGLIGWLIVDPLNGDMYSLSARAIDANLKANPQSVLTNERDVSIVLLQNVPEKLRPELVKIN